MDFSYFKQKCIGVLLQGKIYFNWLLILQQNNIELLKIIKIYSVFYFKKEIMTAEIIIEEKLIAQWISNSKQLDGPFVHLQKNKKMWFFNERRNRYFNIKQKEIKQIIFCWQLNLLFG